MAYELRQDAQRKRTGNTIKIQGKIGLKAIDLNERVRNRLNNRQSHQNQWKRERKFGLKYHKTHLERRPRIDAKNDKTRLYIER